MNFNKPWALVFGLTLVLSAITVQAEKVALFLSKDLPAYSQAVEGFRQAFKGESVLFDLEGSKAKGFEFAKKVRQGGYGAVVAFGSKAAVVAKNGLPSMPMAFCMVVKPKALGLIGSGRIAGIAFAIPIKKQLLAAKQFVPNARRIGVLHQPSSTLWLKKAREAAKAGGFEIVGGTGRLKTRYPRGPRSPFCSWYRYFLVKVGLRKEIPPDILSE